LSKTREQEVSACIADPGLLARAATRLDTGEPNFRIDELERALASHQANLLDVRSRRLYAMGHLRQALSIPLEELLIRAPWELERSKLQVVDCSYFTKHRCNRSVNILVDAGFKAAALNAGSIVQ